MPRNQGLRGPGRRRGSIVGAVIDDHEHDPVDAENGEERPGSGEEFDGGRGLIREGFDAG